MTGSGTVGDPYIIQNVTDLQDIENNLSSYYELEGNIDASVTSGWNSNAGFIPITAFTGQLDGKGYAIDQLFIGRISSWEQGLIGENTSGTIQNLGMTACDITGRSTGSICAENKGTITNCYSTGAVAGKYAGGFAEANPGTITQCYSTCNVTATDASGNAWAGGFVNHSTGTIQNCYARGSLTDNASGTCYLAGFIINNNGGTVEDCYSTGAIDVAAENRFGFGDGDADHNCFWDTETSGLATSDIGTGKTTAQMKTRATFADAGWDFETVWGIDGVTNNAYPYLAGGVSIYPLNPLIRVSGIVRTFWAGVGGQSVYQAVLTLGGISTTFIPPIGSREPPSAVVATPTPRGAGYQQADYETWLRGTDLDVILKLFGHFPTYQEWVSWKAASLKQGFVSL